MDVIRKTLWNTEFKQNEQNSNFKKSVLNYLGVQDLIFEHYNPFIKFYNCKFYLFLYRNPFDCLVSRYFFFYKKRQKSSYNNLTRVILKELPYYTKQFKIMKKMSNNKNVKIICYENLIVNPFETALDILKFLKIKSNKNKLMNSIKNSSVDNFIKSDKQLDLSSLIKNKGSKMSFIHDKAIGKWKKYLNETDYNLIIEDLKKSNIDINEFIIE